MRNKRIWNFLIDSFCIELISILIAHSFVFIASYRKEYIEVDSTSLLFPVFIFYYFSSECIFNITIGKLITKTKIVTETGEKPSLNQIVKRNVLRILVPIDVLSFAINTDGTGFHDNFSGTYLTNKW